MSIDYSSGCASEEGIFTHLSRCDNNFVPPLSSRVEIRAYASKIADKAEQFEAWSNGELVGLVAAYCNALDRDTAYITSISILPGYHRRGIALRLMTKCIQHIRELGFKRIELEVGGGNEAAIALYEKYGLNVVGQSGVMKKMTKELGKEI